MFRHTCTIALLFGTLYAAPIHAQTITLNGTVRDFHSFSSSGFYNPDFENAGGDDRGIVQSTLGADGTPQYGNHPNGTATTHGATFFNQWYHDTPNYNVNLSVPITLTQTAPNVYGYTNNDFFPIDNRGFGNEGRPHNFSFTYEIHARFGYRGGETLTFTGDDDVFVYLNKKLVMDLGGVHNPQTASVNVDAIANSIRLTQGNNYDFDLFFAERHFSGSTFGITTSLQLQNVPEPSALAAFIIGAVSGGAMLLRRKRKA